MKTKFRIDISTPVLEDLKKRLTETRWPDQIDNKNWESGANLQYLQQICEYWNKEFNWHNKQEYLNSFDHYTSVIDSENIHFIYQKGQGTKNIPLLLIHGFPDSFIRFLKVIPLLTQPGEDGVAFDVVVPSIPGYGFSQIPMEAGMNTKKIAGLFADLMTKELGYEKFVSHGGDWGGGITEQLALCHEKHLLGIHLTDVPFQHAMKEVKNPTPAEKKFYEKIKMWQQTEGAYALIQSTKPQSLSYGLNDSPAGLAAWILDKFYAWSDHNGNLGSAFSKDDLLINLTIYWATETINSSLRLYYETIKAIMNAEYNPMVKLNPFDKTGDKSQVPAGFAIFPKDIAPPPKEFAERFFDVKRWNEMKSGGHFAAMEQPEDLVSEIREFVKIIS